MNPNKLSHAILIGLTAITVTACGGDDNTIQHNTIPSPQTTQPSTAPTPSPAPTPDFVELGKQAGLSDGNAATFAEAVKNLTVDSIEYKTALEQAIKAQTTTDLSKNTAPTNDPVSTKVDKANPFIKGVDVSRVPTMGSSHYIRHPGSTYERTANPSAIGGLGAVATDDPTKSNPWLTNYVLGVEAVRQLDGSVKAVAIDSTGERVVAISGGNSARKLGIYDGNQTYADDTTETTNKGFIPATGSATHSPYLNEYDGLIYSTQRNDGTHLLYNYSNATINANGDIVPDANPKAVNIKTLQEQNSKHSMVFDSTHIANAMLAAKNQNYNTFNASNPQDSAGNSKKDRTGSRTNFGNYTRTGLIVYNDDSRPTLNSRGNPTGYLVPSWGREENIYRLSSDGNSLRIENGVNVLAFAPQFSPINNDNIAQWNSARYGAAESIYDIASGSYKWHNGRSVIPDFGRAILVANNDPIRLFGKNALSYEAGAEGQQTRDNSYTAKFDHKGKLTNITRVQLHHTQYGRLTNNIDVIAEESITDKTRVLYRALQPHGAPNTVDTYFYRGTNHTTLDEMATIKARGGTYRYFGHALTYGLGPIAPTQDPQPTGVPTAYSIPQPEAINTIGNFVEATFDAGKGRVEGHIYNFRNKNVNDNPDDFFKQNLASFSGDVFGNTVVGIATNPADPNRTGSLTASFFGQGASELGGQISSISREQGYGTPRWGAVFGATRGTVVDNFNVIENK